MNASFRPVFRGAADSINQGNKVDLPYFIYYGDMGQIHLRLDDQGRLAIPSSWRRKYGLKPSNELILSEEPDGSLRILTPEQGVLRAQELVRRYIPENISLSRELREERREEARRESQT